MVQRFKETGHPVFDKCQCLEIVEIWEMLKGKENIHFNAGAPNTQLLFRIIHSVNRLSIYGAVSNCCEQVGWTTDVKGREKLSQKESTWTKKYQRAWIRKKWTLWCFLQDIGTWKQIAGKHSKLRVSVREYTIHKDLRTRIVLVPGIGWYELQDQTWRGRRLWRSHPSIPRTHTSSRAITLSRASYAAIPRRSNLSGQSLKFTSYKCLEPMDLKSKFHLQIIPERTSWVLISRGKSRLVDELHIPNVSRDLTSAELLSEQENAKESAPCLAKSQTGSSGNWCGSLILVH